MSIVPHKRYRTWIEIDTRKLRANVSEFLKLIPSHTKLMAVIKSNAYGHGIVGIAKALAVFPKFKARGWFGVDSITEALRLRKEGIKLPILVLGYMLPDRLLDASRGKISITVSTFQILRIATRLHKPLRVHLKFDTGMHRQGFYASDLPAILLRLRGAHHIMVEGVYTHFASTKDIRDPYGTRWQFKDFLEIVHKLRAVYPKILVHASASGGALLFPDTHEDIVRVGIGMYGYFPSRESKVFLRRKIKLQPILQWKSIISELKWVERGERIGYDGTERVLRKSRIAVIPIGYWHGFDRGFSSCGKVLIRGTWARVMGRVSMDMIVVDVTEIPKVRIGDTVVLIGTSSRREFWGEEYAALLGTTVYEVLTRINPLIFKVYQ